MIPVRPSLAGLCSGFSDMRNATQETASRIQHTPTAKSPPSPTLDR